MDDAGSRDETLRRVERHVRGFFFGTLLKIGVLIVTPLRSECSSTSAPEWTWPNYPEGFQGSQIPVHGPYVAKLIEDRADGFLP